MAISLSTFEDNIDPELLDEARASFATGSLSLIDEGTENLWSAEFSEAGSEQAVAVEIRRKTVSYAECTCDAFDENEWGETPCKHIVALLFAAKQHGGAKSPAAPKKPASTGKSTKEKGAKKLPAAKKLDAAETLLGELDPKEIYDFVRQLIAKNKEFKSLFLLHFSEKTGTGEQQFDEIVSNAISAVKGRRKHLKGADGAKMASALTPLYKQAANAEAKGYFREAFHICRTFLKHLPPVFAAMETASAKLTTLFDNTLDLLTLVIKNPDTPFEFRDEVFEALMKEYEFAQKNYEGTLKDELFRRLKQSARITKRLDEVAALLEQLVRHYQAMGKKSHWSSEYYAEIRLIERLIEFYEEELQAPNKVLALLEANKHHLDFYLQLIGKKTEAGDFDTAIGYVEDIKKNLRKYQNQWPGWQLEQRANELLLDIYQKRGDPNAIAPLAGRLFEESHYMNFKYYDLEKSVTPPEKWKKRVERYLKAARPAQFRLAIASNPYFEILTREARWTQLRDDMAQVSNLMTWENYGTPVATEFPEVYLQCLRKNIGNELRLSYSSQYQLAGKLLQKMADMPGGASIVREMLAEYRRLYPQRREIMRILDRVKV